MKRLLILLFIISPIIYSQSGWFWLNPLPQGNNLKDLYFFNPTAAYCLSTDYLLKSSDGGNTWKILYTGYEREHISLCMIDENTGFVYLDSTIMIKTTNGGVNWALLSKPGIKYVKKMYFRNSATGYIIASVSEYNQSAMLSRTSNRGLTWNTVLSDTSYSIGNIQFTSLDTGYLVGSKRIGASSQYHLKVFKSINGGLKWDSVTNNININTATICFVNNTTGYLAGNNWVYKTTDGGVNWLIKGYMINGASNVVFKDEWNGFAISNNYFFKTTNGGINWSSSQLNGGGYYSILTDIKFYDLNTGIITGTDGGIFKTVNAGISWEQINKGSRKHIYDIKFADANTGFAAGEDCTFYSTTNGGNDWRVTTFDPNDEISELAVINDKVCYGVSYFNGNFYKTTNSGLTWDYHYFDWGVTRIDFINELTGFGVCKYQRFMKTTNGGLNWIATNDLNHTQNWALDFLDENTGYAGGGSLIYKTTNGGIIWDTTRLPFPAEINDIYFINPSTGFAVGRYVSGTIFKTTDAGSTWKFHYTEGLSNVYRVKFTSNEIGILTSSSGVYKSTNAGINWFKIKTCSAYPLFALSFVNEKTGFLAGDYGQIIKTTNGGELIGKTTLGIPDKFYLYQNYPNPFNPLTTIKFEVPEIPQIGFMHIKIIVYDIIGRYVVTLADDDYGIGTHELRFDGSRLASGIYFCRLETEGFSITKKMVLMK